MKNIAEKLCLRSATFASNLIEKMGELGITTLTTEDGYSVVSKKIITDFGNYYYLTPETPRRDYDLTYATTAKGGFFVYNDPNHWLEYPDIGTLFTFVENKKGLLKSLKNIEKEVTNGKDN